MKCLMTFAIVLTSEPFLASRPLADVWTFLCVRSQMASQIKSPRKGAPAARHRTLEVSLVPPSTGAGDLSGRRRDLLLLDLENGRQTRDTVARRRIVVSARTGDGAVGSRDGLLLTHAHALSVVVELCSVGSEE